MKTHTLVLAVRYLDSRIIGTEPLGVFLDPAQAEYAVIQDHEDQADYHEGDWTGLPSPWRREDGTWYSHQDEWTDDASTVYRLFLVEVR
jgi:hypothetical protein